jgi:hypothetical protein
MDPVGAGLSWSREKSIGVWTLIGYTSFPVLSILSVGEGSTYSLIDALFDDTFFELYSGVLWDEIESVQEKITAIEGFGAWKTDLMDCI